MNSIVVNAVKFHSVNDTHGYAVEKLGNSYVVSFVRKIILEGKNAFLREAFSRNRGRDLSFSSPFVADYMIRSEILPLYKKAA